LIRNGWAFEYGVTWDDVYDKAPYIAKFTGSTFGAFVRANWLF
jgi:hypothetical protein